MSPPNSDLYEAAVRLLTELNVWPVDSSAQLNKFWRITAAALMPTANAAMVAGRGGRRFACDRPATTRKGGCILVALSLLLPITASAGQWQSSVMAVARQVPTRAFEAQALLIGETHGKARSHALTWALIQRALKRYTCVQFALEVHSDGRQAWRRAASHPEALDKVGLTFIHDSPSLRRLMVRTSKLARHACLSVHPIDEPDNAAVEVQSRDKYMARRLKRLVDNGPFVVALVGSLHAVRRLDWAHGQHGKPLAQLLEEAGASVYVLVEDWVAGLAEPRIYMHDSEAAAAAIDQLLWAADVVDATSFQRYADMLVQWPKRDGD